MNTRNPA
jgi:hypothetical protein